MWQCPKCGRDFKRNNQEHYCGKPPETVGDYIAAQPERIQPYLISVRETLRGALPGVQERISWGMPTYRGKYNIIHFSAFKNHIGLYPGEKAVGFFTDRLTEYRTGHGSVHLPYDKPLPLALIAEIAKWCLDMSLR